LKLIVLHYHFRPGGVRRVIELAAPFLLQTFNPPIREIVLASGEAVDAGWLTEFHQKLNGIPVREFVAPAFGYVSELEHTGEWLVSSAREAVAQLLEAEEDVLLWMHNAAVGRNLPFTNAVARLCAERNFPLVMHHHDWWFDNRWSRWPEFCQTGFRTLEDTAAALFQTTPSIRHVAINQSDTQLLKSFLGAQAEWLPNPMSHPAPMACGAVENAQAWLAQKAGTRDAPFWILPCRLLRRKNIAEALLLTRWLRPEAWLITTGGVSSMDELHYAQTLTQAAREHGWRLKLSVLANEEHRAPKVAELVAASEAVVLTSIQEGFGLPYLEAAEAGRPLIARNLPNVAPDLHQLGLTFPQSYDEICVDASLFDLAAERERQRVLFAEWKSGMPEAVRAFAVEPSWLKRGEVVPFSRLTLSAQLEVLAKPARDSWKIGARLNPFLERWRTAVAMGTLKPSEGLESAQIALSGEVYAQRLAEIVARPVEQTPKKIGALQNEFIRTRLAPENLYPLLWAAES